MHSDLLFLDSSIKMPLMNLPVRSVLARLDSGASVLISPGSKLTPAQLREAAPVTDLVAPNTLHNAGMKQAREVYPQAKAWGPQGAGQPEVLSEERWPYTAEMPILALAGMPKVKEFILFHKKSKTLIVTDAAFNLQKTSGMGAWLILSLFGTYRKFGVSRFWLKFADDKEALAASLKKVFEWDFDNLVVSHGEALYGGAREKFQSACRERGLLV